jgi:hypothetical protein
MMERWFEIRGPELPRVLRNYYPPYPSRYAGSDAAKEFKTAEEALKVGMRNHFFDSPKSHYSIVEVTEKEVEITYSEEVKQPPSYVLYTPIIVKER